MAAKVWYLWDGVKECFVSSQRPPKNARLAAKLQRVRVRLAGSRDRQKLFEFQRESLETEPEIWVNFDLQEVREGLERWEPSAYPNSFVIIAELDRKIIGLLLLVIYYRFDNGCPSADIEDLFVLKDFRGYKVATRLVEFASKLALQKGCEALGVSVGPRNLAALSFYRENGFEVQIKEVGLASLTLKGDHESS